MEKAMDEFYKDYHVTLHKELRKITDSLKEMMVLVDQDKKLLEKSRKKRTIHADQMPELEEEREIIERLDKYTGQIELLVEAKGRIKAEIFERHKEAMLRGVMVKEDNESAERRKIKEEEELVVKMREDERLKKLEEAEKAKKEADERRLKKLQRSLSKSAANKLVKYRGKIDEEDDYANVKVPSFNKVSYKETMLKDIERRKKNTKTRAMTKSFGMKANHTDKLYKRNLKTHFEMEAVRMQVRKLREEDAMSRTTFKPQLNKRSLEIAETWEPHKVRAQESLEKARLDTIKKRALSYLESPKKHSVESKENKTSAAFKTKDLFCNHMYAKTMKWDEERRNLIENRRRQKEEEEYRELNKVPSSQRRRQNSPLRQQYNHVNNGSSVYQRLYNDKDLMKENKMLLEKQYKDKYSPFKPVTNIAKEDILPQPRRAVTPSPRKVARHVDRSEDFLNSLLNELTPKGGRRNSRVQTMVVPRYEKEAWGHLLD